MSPNFIFVTGGVISGLGKGIVTSSIGKLLQARGFKVTAVKIDPYLNSDAGTMRPTEHGEVWVTEDGGEIDQDLGNYERFLDVTLGKCHNITTGQIYSAVIEKERRGDYLGKTVEIIPHVTNEIKWRIKKVVNETNADFVLVEIGGTVGEYQNEIYYRAARMMKTEGERVIFVHVGYLPVPKHIGEMKSKPLQQSVETLGRFGIQPDFIICRSENLVDEVRKEKIAMFCNLSKDDLISNPDLKNIYELPLIFEQQNFSEKILEKFQMIANGCDLVMWKNFVYKMQNANNVVKIGIVGKYFDTGDYRLSDSYLSVIESIKYACANNGAKPEIIWIDSKDFEQNNNNFSLENLRYYNGLVVPGGFGSGGVEGKIIAIEFARKNNIPYLGLCYGLQLAVIEFARNVCDLAGAHTTEIDPTTQHPVIDFLPWQKKLLEESRYGATMRLGGQLVEIIPGTNAHRLYGKTQVIERFRHRYEINPDYVEILQRNGFVFSGRSSKDQNIMQIGELPNHKFFMGSQFHPEFTSRPLKPNPLFDGFIKACIQ